jgi:hypothetical protein
VPPATFTVGGTVSGLDFMTSVTLQNNSSNDIIQTADGVFTFPAQAEGTDYAVTVSSQPTGQTCSVTGGGGNNDGSGTVGAANVTSVTVTCTFNSFAIDSHEFSVDANKFYFDVFVSGITPTYSANGVLRIGSEAAGIGGSNTEVLRVNYETQTGMPIFTPHEVVTIDTPVFDRWLDGAIDSLEITANGTGSWRIVGSVLHGTEPYAPGDLVDDLYMRVFDGDNTINLRKRDTVIIVATPPPPPPADSLYLDITSFFINPWGMRISRASTVWLNVMVNSNSQSTATVEATVVAKQGLNTVFTSGPIVLGDTRRSGATSHIIATGYTPTTPGTITWTVSFEDDNADDDSATVRMKVR